MNIIRNIFRRIIFIFSRIIFIFSELILLSNFYKVIAVNEIGDMIIISLDGTYYFPYSITNELPFTSSAMVTDLDNDGD